MDTALNFLGAFVYYYPMLMAFIWIFGSLLFRASLFSDLKQEPFSDEPVPSVSIIIPCHNEEGCLEETVRRLRDLELDTFEVILVNDCSTDSTYELMKDLKKRYADMDIKLITLTSNQGKGTGMVIAAMVSKYEYIMGIDADAVLDPKCIKYLVYHLYKYPYVGAVTGNPKVRNRTTTLAKVQTGEFASIIGMIKRTQRLMGVIYTVSGVVACFRKQALLDAGFWSNDMVTEDIDISWKIQLAGWDVRFEERALCWILVPETVKGIFRQRMRWSQGGNEVLLKYWKSVFKWKNRKMGALYMEYAVSVMWCYAFFAYFILLGICGNLQFYHFFNQVNTSILATVTIVQFSLGLYLESRYDKTHNSLIPYLIWYPVFYWTINTLVTVISLPKAILKRKGTLATWVSPDRGLKKDGSSF